MPVFLPQQFHQPLRGLCTEFVRHQVKIQCHNMGRLGLRRHAAVFPEKGSPEFVHYFPVQRPIPGRILPSVQNGGNFGKESRRIRKIRRTGQVVGRGAEIASLFRVQGNPVPELKTVVPYVVDGVFFHKADPLFHAFILFFQYGFVAVCQVHGPGIDHRHIRPGRGGMGSLGQKPVVFFLSADYVRHHMGHAPFRRLVCGHILQPLPEKLVCVHEIAGRPAENLGVPCPAHPLVPLGTVRGNIQEITLQPPENILLQPVYQRVGAVKRPCPLHLGIQRKSGEILLPYLPRPFQHLHIPKAHEGKAGMIFLPLPSFADVMDLLLCGTQICRVHISPRIQRLKTFQDNFTAPVCLHAKVHPARQVLPKVNHSVPLRRHQDFPGPEPLHFPHPAACLGSQHLF